MCIRDSSEFMEPGFIETSPRDFARQIEEAVDRDALTRDGSTARMDAALTAIEDAAKKSDAKIKQYAHTATYGLTAEARQHAADMQRAEEAVFERLDRAYGELDERK